MLDALVVEAERGDARLGLRDARVGDAGEEEVLPDGEADVAVAAFARRVAARPRIWSVVSLPTGSTTPIQLQARLLLRMDAEMGEAVRRRARRDVLGRDARQRPPELRLDGGEELARSPRRRARISAAPCCGSCGRRSR